MARRALCSPSNWQPSPELTVTDCAVQMIFALENFAVGDTLRPVSQEVI